MRRMRIYTDDIVVCRSDRGDRGWSLHAPGSTDAEIATGDARPLVSGDAGDPAPQDYRTAAEQLAPWATDIVAVEGGYLAFESSADAETWQRQI